MKIRRWLIRVGAVDAMATSGSTLLRRIGYRIRLHAVADAMQETTRRP